MNDQIFSDKRPLKSGYTTGTCATAAAKAATLALCGLPIPVSIEVELPSKQKVFIAIVEVYKKDNRGYATVRKEAGDDPDVTQGTLISATITWEMVDKTRFYAGQGIGIVTKPGLQVAVGEPAINPVPRKMIHQAIQSITQKPVKITISAPYGETLAKKTYNPRLGIMGGISILGTTGIVRPYSRDALVHSLRCALDICKASHIQHPVFVPGNMGRKAALRHFQLASEQIIDVNNEWEEMLAYAQSLGFLSLLALGHPGKLAKLACGDWNTHSHYSQSAVPYAYNLAIQLGYQLPDDLPTVEGIFQSLPPNQQLGNVLAEKVRQAIVKKIENQFPINVVLTDTQSNWLGAAGSKQAFYPSQ